MSKHDFQGILPDNRASKYSKLVLPVVWCKNAIESIRGFLERIIWAELIKGETVDNEVFNLIIFILFCLISLVSYRFKNYYVYGLIASGIIWYLDTNLAKSKYFNSLNPKQAKIKTSLIHNKDDSCIWKIISSSDLPRQYKFHSNNIQHIEIESIIVTGGAFTEKISKAWQSYIILRDDTKLLMYEHVDIFKIFKESKTLADYFNISLIFTNSEGKGKYVDNQAASTHKYTEKEKLSAIRTKSESLQLRQTVSGWHIFTKWTLRNSWHFFGRVFQKAGFLLFVVMLTQFMFEFGKIIDNMLIAYRSEEPIFIDISGIIRFFTSPNFSWVEWSSIIFAVYLLIFEGAKLSQIKHITIDKQKIKLAINRKVIGECDRSTIDDILLLRKPELMVLILSDSQILKINELIQPEDYDVLLNYLEDKLLDQSL